MKRHHYQVNSGVSKLNIAGQAPITHGVFVSEILHTVCSIRGVSHIHFDPYILIVCKKCCSEVFHLQEKTYHVMNEYVYDF